MTLFHRATVSALAILTLPLAACGDGEKTDAQLQADIVSNMHRLVMSELQGLNQAALDVQAAAPSSIAQGWDVSGDGGAAIAAMKEAWTRTRLHWERAEGTLEPLFPSLDQSMDSRYEDSLEQMNGSPDPDPFDGQGVTGMHAIERILFAPGPAPVVAYESSLAGYSVAAPPATDPEAADFKSGLCQRQVDDSQRVLTQWGPLVIDLGVVFTGLTGQLSAQAEKVGLAANHQQESRYSQTTMADLRSNLAGTRAIYQLFVPWLATKPFGTTLDSNASAAFDRLDQLYAAVSGDSIPDPPPTWGANPETLEDLNSPFGMLYITVVEEVDPSRPGSAVDAMNHVAQALGLPQFSPPP